MKNSRLDEILYRLLDSPNELDRRIKHLIIYCYAAFAASTISFFIRLNLSWNESLLHMIGTIGPCAIFSIVSLWAVHFIKKHPTQKTINFAVSANLITVFLFVLFRQGALSPVILGIPIVAFLAGFLIGPIYSVIYSSAGAFGYALIVIAQAGGILPQPKPYLAAEATVVGIMLVSFSALITSLVTWLFFETFEKRRRKAAESENKYRTLVDNIPDPVILFDKDGRISHANPAALERFGYTSKEIATKSWEHIVLPARIEAVKKLFEKHILSNKSQIFESIVRTSSGEEFPVEINSTPISEDAKHSGFVCIYREITERKKIEDALRENERFLSDVFSGIQDGITVLDKDLNIVRTNPIVEKWFDHKKPLYGKKCYNIFHGLDSECKTCPSRIALNTGKPHVEILPRKGKGELNQGWVEVYAFPLRDSKSGEVSGTIEYVRDITEKKRYEEAHNQSQERYMLLAEAAQDFIFVIDRDFKVSYVNSYAASVFGKKPADIIGKAISALFPTPVLERQKASLKRVFESGEPFFIENKSMFPGGEMWLDTKLVPLKSANGKVESVLGVSRDITPKKKDEERLRLLSSAIEQASEGMAIVTPNGDIIFSNNAFAAMHGYDPEELTGKNLIIFHHPDQYPSVFAANKQILEEGSFSGEIWHMRKNGTRFPTLMRNSQLRDSDGNIIGIIGTMRDITDIKFTAERLKESEQLYRGLIETSPDSIILLDMDQRIVFANKKSAEYLGFKDEADLIGLRMRDRVHPDDKPKELEVDKIFLETGRLSNIELWTRKEDGTYFLAEINANLLRDEKGAPRATLAIVRDVTEKRKADRALRESEERYRSLVNTSPDTIVLIGPDLRVQFANDKALELYGTDDMSEVIGLSALDLIAPEDRNKAIEEFAFHINTGKPFTQVYNCKNKKGELIPSEATTGVVLGADGKPIGVVSVMRDVTERRLAEKKLKESELHYRSLIETSPDGVIFIGINGKIETANRQAALLFGYEKDSDLIGIQPDTMLIEEDRLRVGKIIAKIYRTHEPIDREVFGCLRKDGLSFISEISARPIMNTEDKPAGLLVVLRDVTERMLFETQLRESEERFRHLADAALEAIVFHDHGVIVEVNKAAMKLYGFSSPDEVIGKSVFSFVHPDYHEIIKNNFTSSISNSIEAIGIKRDGTQFNIETSAGPAVYRGKTIRMVAIHDITARKKAEEESNKLHEKLILSDRMASIGQLVLGIAHEFNNILAGLRGYAQLSMMPGKQNRLNELPPLVVELVDRAQGITENLLGFSERFNPAVENVRPREMINGILKLMRKDLELAGIKVEVNIPKDSIIYTDSGKLQQVLLNLIINARHAMPRGGKLSFNVKKENGKTTLSIEDTGDGIPPENLTRIFDPFFTTKGALGGGKLPGTGLGLSLSYGIMQSLGGNIEVKSEVGKGSVFSLVMPTGEHRDKKD